MLAPRDSMSAESLGDVSVHDIKRIRFGFSFKGLHPVCRFKVPPYHDVQRFSMAVFDHDEPTNRRIMKDLYEH